jgi:hypothetical protein
VNFAKGVHAPTSAIRIIYLMELNYLILFINM